MCGYLVTGQVLLINVGNVLLLLSRCISTIGTRLMPVTNAAQESMPVNELGFIILCCRYRRAILEEYWLKPKDS